MIPRSIAAALALLFIALAGTGCDAVRRREYATHKQALTRHLDAEQLPFWTSEVLRDPAFHGFMPMLDNELKPTGETSRNAIVQLRRLYVQAIALARAKNGERYELLRRQYDELFAFIRAHYWDQQDGGFYWDLTEEGKPASETKGTLAQVYAIYVLAEINVLLGDRKALELAESTFKTIDPAAHDAQFGGYVQDQSFPLDHPQNAHKTGGVNMHMLLALTRLYSSAPQVIYRTRLEELFGLLTTHFEIPDSGGNGYYALTRDWKEIAPEQPEDLDTQTCYGHNAELIWYSMEAATALGKKSSELLPLWTRLTDGLIAHGIHPDGMVYFAGHYRGEATKRTIYWWSQTEAMIALLRMYELTGRRQYWEMYCKVEDWTFRHFVLDDRGCWIISTGEDGKPSSTLRTGGNWKAGLHEVRALLQCEAVLERLGRR